LHKALKNAITILNYPRFIYGFAMIEDKYIELTKKLEFLRRAHRALEQKITDLGQKKPYDEFSAMRIKKEKLAVRDQILQLENQLYPDIIA
jgi:hypothetical protein